MQKFAVYPVCSSKFSFLKFCFFEVVIEGLKKKVFKALFLAFLFGYFISVSFADSDRHPVHPDHQGTNYTVNEYSDGNTSIYTDAETDVSIPIPSGYDVIDWNDPIHRPTKTQHLPKKGTVRINGNFFIYEPYKHAEGYDVFTWWPDKRGEDNNYSVEVKILPQKDNPKFYLNSITDGNLVVPTSRTDFPFREGSAISHTELLVFDPDSYNYAASDSDLNATFEPDDEGEYPDGDPNDITIFPSDPGNVIWTYFDLSLLPVEFQNPSPSKAAGWILPFQLSTHGGGELDYERFKNDADLTTDYDFSVTISDGDYSVDIPLRLKIQDIEEGPDYLPAQNNDPFIETDDYWVRVEEVDEDSEAVLDYTLRFNDDEGDQFKLRMQRTYDYDQADKKRASVFVDYEGNGNFQELNYDPNATGDTATSPKYIDTDTDHFFDSGQDIRIQIRHDIPNAFGREIYRFTPIGSNGRGYGKPIQLTVNLRNTDDPVQFFWGDGFDDIPQEPEVRENESFVIDLDSWDLDSHILPYLQIENPLATFIYKLFPSEADNSFFEVNGSGVLRFKVPPDYEDPKDHFTENAQVQDNKYQVRIRLYDSQDEIPLESELALDEPDDILNFTVTVTNQVENPQLESPTGKQWLDDGDYNRTIYTDERKDWIFDPSDATRVEELRVISDEHKKLIEGYNISWGLYDDKFQTANHQVIINPIENIPDGYHGRDGPFEFRFVPDANLRGASNTSFRIEFRVDDGPPGLINYNVVVRDVPDPPVLADNGIRLTGSKYNENSLEAYPISPPISDSIKNYDISFYENYPLDVTLEFTAEGDDDQDIEYAKVLESEDWSSFGIVENFEGEPTQIHLILPNAESFDYEELGDRNYSLKVEVKDTSPVDFDNENPRVYNFNFIFRDENEPPVVVENWERWGGPKFVPEEQEFVLGLSASDPEDLSSNDFTWQVLGANAQTLAFQPNTGTEVELKFLDGKYPNFEISSDLNVTYQVTDKDGVSYTKTLQLAFLDRPDPPKIKSTYSPLNTILIPLNENSVSVISLEDYFIEEGSEVFYSLDTDESREFFSISTQSNKVIFQNPVRDADFENPEVEERERAYSLKLKAQTEMVGVEKTLTFRIEIKDLANEVPVAIDSEYNLLSAPDLISAKTWEVFLSKDGGKLMEDGGPYSIDLNLSIYDPQDPTGSLVITALNGMSEFLNYETDGTFILDPPQDHFGPLSIDLNLTDGPGQYSSYLKVVFHLEDVDDRPTFTMVDDQGVTTLFDPSTGDGINTRVYIEEGKVIIRELFPSDAKDTVIDNEVFYWSLEPLDGGIAGTGDDRYFKLSTYQIRPGQSTQLLWDLDAVGAPTTRYNNHPPNGATNKIYQFNIILSELNPLDRATDGSTDDSTILVPINLEIIDSTIPPIFLETDGDSEVNAGMAKDSSGKWTADFQEGITEKILLRAVDFDGDDDPDDTNVTIIKYRVEGFDQDFFDVSPKEGEDTSLVVIDGKVLDFENPQNLDASSPNAYKIRVVATKWVRDNSTETAPGVYEDETETEFSSTMDLTIHLKNTVEPPYFKAISTNDVDSNFSIDEQTFASFVVQAGTDDFDKDINVSLIADQKDGKYFETISGEGNRTEFRFFLPPDFENPRDDGFDNIYEVDFTIKTNNSDSDLTETLKVKVNDLTSILEIKRKDDSPFFDFQHYENRPFVADFDVVDMEGEYFQSKAYPDLILLSNSGVHYASNSWHEESAGTLFENFEVDRTDRNDNSITLDKLDLKPVSVDEANFAVFGDINNDGSTDVISFTSNEISVFANDGLGQFNVSSSDFDGRSFTGLDHTILVDLDTDGDEDLIVAARTVDKVHIFENKSDPSAVGFKELGPNSSVLEATDGISGPHFVVSSDVDDDGELDLVVANSGSGQVLWYRNLGGLSFDLGGVVADNIDNPYCLEVVDIDGAQNLGDPFACRDFLIGGKQAIYLARNDGDGNFVVSRIVSPSNANSGFDETISTCRAIKAIDLDNDRTTIDFVYITNSPSQLSPLFVLQSASGFSTPYPFFDDDTYVQNTHIEKQFGDPSSLQVYLMDDGQNVPVAYIFLSDENRPHAWVFQARPITAEPFVQIGEPSTFLGVDDGSGIDGNLYSLGLADLDTKSNFVKFKISGGIDESFFDEGKIESGGKLLFKNPPDYESPADADGFNNYRVTVTAFIGDDPDDESSWLAQTSESVTVEVLDANDPPSIDLLFHETEGNVAGTDGVIFLERPENRLDIVDRIDFTNHEIDENVTFSISGGADESLFEIDPKTGRLSYRDDHVIFTQLGFPDDSLKYGRVNFTFLPDFENNDSADLDGNYSVTVRATDDGGEFDEQSIIVGIRNAPEEPSDIDISDHSLLSLITDEDVNVDISNLGNLITPTSPTQLTFGVYPYHGLEIGQAEVVEISGQSNFLYSPDNNLSGNDQVFITVDDGGGALYCVAVEINVTPIPDPPVSRVPTHIKINENIKKVVALEAYDADENELLTWSLSKTDDPIFKIVNDVLYFQFAPDFEDPHALANSNVYTAELNLYDRDQFHTVPVVLEVAVQNLPDTKPASILVSGQENVIERVEGENVIVNLEASDPDAVNPGQADQLTILLSGTDASHFVVVDGLIKVFGGATLDFENPVDANGDNLYEIEVYIGDADLNETYFTTIKVLDLDETPPYFVTGKDQVPYEIPVQENQKFIVQAVATDPETSDLVYSIVGGGEEEFFVIDASYGLLEFKEGQNYEYPADANNDGRFEVIIQVSDGTYNVTQTIIVRLTDLNDIPYVLGADNTLPYFEPGSYSLNEDGYIKADFEIIDEDGDGYVFEPHSPPSLGTFSMNSTFFTYTPDKNFTGTDSFVVKLADDQGSRLQTLELKVLPIDDPPVAEQDDVFYGDLKQEFPLFFDVLANDHAGPDDSSEEQFYEVQALSLPKNGLLQEEQSNSGNGRYYYTPNKGFIGEDTFEYSLMDKSKSLSSSVGLVRIWIAKTESMPMVTSLRNLGYYIEGNTNWVYSLKMGWVYAKSLQGLYSTTWIWHDQIGWFWTGEDYFGWLYYNDDSKWLHWEGGVNDPNGWFLRDTQENLYQEVYFEKKVVRNQVKSILPSLDDLAEFVNSSSFFSDSQKSQILRELVFTRRSPTLDRILEFDFSY